MPVLSPLTILLVGVALVVGRASTLNGMELPQREVPHVTECNYCYKCLVDGSSAPAGHPPMAHEDGSAERLQASSFRFENNDEVCA